MGISANDIKAFRDKTGLPMMECKTALVEANGDEEKALDILRKRGFTKAAKMADREAGQGRVACFVDEAARAGGIIELRCETAPVANTDDFINLCNTIAREAALNEGANAETMPERAITGGGGRKISDAMNDVFNRLRENMQLKRIARLTGEVGSYVHHNGQVGALIEMSKPCSADVKGDVCMQIVAMKPPYLKSEDVPTADVERQREAARAEITGKPANIVDKIVDGKIKTWFGEITLLGQAFVKSDKFSGSVQEYLNSVSPGLTVNRFVRFEVGLS
ncbi:MAG: translation elongation factor Ts [Phycisphaerales bacterium]|nr:translation elongation factor Ts [Phycisphaerales bacterium]